MTKEPTVTDAELTEAVKTMPDVELLGRVCRSTGKVLADLYLLALVSKAASIDPTKAGTTTDTVDDGVKFGIDMAKAALKRALATLERDAEGTLKHQKEGESLLDQSKLNDMLRAAPTGVSH